MAKRQVIFIHGGESFEDYDAFLTHLQTTPLRNVLADKPRRWKETLRSELGTAYEVYMPSMPNSENARYVEWKIWFERYLALVDDGVILVGHSLGGWFLVKYLLEEAPHVHIGALILIAAPATQEGLHDEDGGDFAFGAAALPQLAQRVRTIFILHSTDDDIVPYTHAEMYKKALPTAALRTFETKGHFLQETFPELIELLREI